MQPAILVPSTLDEETARAEIYGLLAALFYAAPTPVLLEGLRLAVTEAPAAGALLESSWSELVAAARAMSAQEVADEYDALFGGVGKPEVYLFGSHYLSGFLNEKPLAALRGELAELGLTRGDTMAETEDHYAYL
jgi:TorA maturation chaperone TorD